MRHLRIEILVIGGGATGTGILRDLAMRGFKCLLVERRDLAYGTTGRYHGLLHSGGRYVVKDPQAAHECYEENQILRRIMPQCIEDTGGYFVHTPQDDPDYIPQFISGCQIAGIPIEEIQISRMLKQEPWLNPHIRQCFRLPDASADSFLAADLNIASAREHGGGALTYHEVKNLVLRYDDGKPIVSGAMCHDLIKDEEVQIDADLVINATGAWAGILAGMAGIQLEMVPGKGTMLALNYRLVNTIINRCKMPSDGDVLVPAHTVSIIGTTDIKVTDPDHYGIEPWEVRLMLDEGEKLIPQFKQFRILRAWAGVRPLIQDSVGASDRDISRAFVLLDHAERDGVDGMLTITSGKWTTYRKMAQVTVDKVCEKLHIDRSCRTHLEPLPDPTHDVAKHPYLGARLETIERNEIYGQLVCECELATQQDVERAIIQSNSATLDDIRRETRLGMGPCQGAYCTFRATGILHSLRHPPVQETNDTLRDFLQERWKGNLPILWGQQLRQARFNELIYADVLNVNSLPVNGESRLATEPYTRIEITEAPPQHAESISHTMPANPVQLHSADVVVIGAGYAGLFTAWQASSRGLMTRVIAQGWGTPYWSNGCIDILGYQPPTYSHSVSSPCEHFEYLSTTNPAHPYNLCGTATIASAIQSFIQLSDDTGYPYHGSLEANIWLPTALGTLRPTCLAPETMISGDASQKLPALIVGFNQYLDFFPVLVADNLNAQGFLARDVTMDLKSLYGRKFVTSMVLARLFEEPEFRKEVIEQLKPRIGSAGRIGFPAVLGVSHAITVKKDLEDALGVPVFEIPGLPPSIPGIRLQNILIDCIERNGGIVTTGMEVNGVSYAGKNITAITSKTSTRSVSHPAKGYVLATGGILGGGFITGSDGYAQERVFNLPIHLPDPRGRWLKDEFLTNTGHPIFKSGVIANLTYQPIDEHGEIIFDNLFVVGTGLGNCDPIRELSLSGIGLVTGYTVAESLSRKLSA